jgi:hypothetical protein
MLVTLYLFEKWKNRVFFFIYMFYFLYKEKENARCDVVSRSLVEDMTSQIFMLTGFFSPTYLRTSGEKKYCGKKWERERKKRQGCVINHTHR